MPLHPWLKEDWIPRAEARIRFLENFADKAGDFDAEERRRPTVFGDLPDPIKDATETNTSNRSILPQVSALTDAADVAFAFGLTRKGLELVKKSLGIISQEPPEHWPIARTCLLGSIGRSDSIVSLNYRGIYKFSPNRSQTIKWHEINSSLKAISAALISSDICHHAGATVRSFLLEDFDDPETNFAKTILLNSEYSRLINLFPAKFEGLIKSSDRRGTEDEEDAWATAVVLHQNYVSRLRLLTVDEDRWHRLRWHVPIIDWPLLAVYLGVYKSGGLERLDQLVKRCSREDTRKLAAFLRELAIELSGSRDRGQSSVRPIPPSPSPGSEGTRFLREM